MVADPNKLPDDALPSDPEQPQLRHISEEELKRILADHKKWLETERKEGNRADLSGANLQGALLRDANLERADLRGANLQGAVLQRACLVEANLTRANLQEANLQGANLQGARNLVQEQLDQACGDEKTQLPEGLEIKTCEPDENSPGISAPDGAR